VTLVSIPRVRVALGGAHSPVTRRVRWSALAALSLLAAGVRPVAAQISVDQAEIVLHPQPSAPSVAGFNVSNETNALVEATVYLMDWDRDQDGGNQFQPVGAVPQSCAKYLRVFPLSLRLPPHTSQGVRLGLQGADSVPATCWSIVFVEAGGPQAGAGRKISYVLRLGVKVYIEPPGLATDGEVEGMAIDTIHAVRVAPVRGAKPAPLAPDTVVSSVRFRNTGGLPAVVHGEMEYRRLDNTVVQRDSIPTFYVLPGAARRARVRVPKLPSGHYVVLALLDFGGSEVAAGQVPLDVP
jgi:P pilus assembly chaperone PapD